MGQLLCLLTTLSHSWDCCLLPQDSGAVTPEPITLEAPKWLQAVNCSSMIRLRFMLF